MSRPNTSFSEPRESDTPLFAADTMPSVIPVLPLDGCDDDMKAIGAALLDAMRAFLTLTEANAENSRLACLLAATQLENLVNAKHVARVRKVTHTVKSRS